MQAAVRQLLVGLQNAAKAWNRNAHFDTELRQVEFSDLRALYPRNGDGTAAGGGGGYKLEDLSRHPAIVWLPYQVLSS